MWDISFLTRDRTHVPCIGRQIPNHWTTKEVPLISSFFSPSTLPSLYLSPFFLSFANIYWGENQKMVPRVSILVSVLQRNRTSRIYIDVYKRRFITGIGSCGYGGREVPQSAICKLQKQENQWHNSDWGLRPELRGCWCKSWSLKTSEPEALMARRRWTSQLRKRKR